MKYENYPVGDALVALGVAIPTLLLCGFVWSLAAKAHPASPLSVFFALVISLSIPCILTIIFEFKPGVNSAKRYNLVGFMFMMFSLVGVVITQAILGGNVVAQ